MADCSISIIIPAYNVDRYLEEALDSIKSQDELPDEVILIDDGSTDLTLEIAQSYQFSIPYHVISIDNNGQGHARNLGIRRASSKYLYFFDSDDCLTNNFIGSIKRLIERNQQPDILLFSGQSFRDTEYRGNLCFDYRRGFSGFLDDRVAFLDQAYSHNALFVSPCLYVSKRSLWGQNRLEFGKNFYEDDAIFYPLIFSCSSFAVIDEVFFLRRLREGSTMTTAPNTKHMNGALFRMRTAIDLYRSPNLTRRERWYIKKRLEEFCSLYFLIARASGQKSSYKYIIEAITTTRSIKLTVKSLSYAIGADKSPLIRNFVHIGRRLLQRRLNHH